MGPGLVALLCGQLELYARMAEPIQSPMASGESNAPWVVIVSLADGCDATACKSMQSISSSLLTSRSEMQSNLIFASLLCV